MGLIWIAAAGVVGVMIVAAVVAARGRAGSPVRPGPARDVGALLRPLAKPALVVREGAGASRSQIGGRPPASTGFVWPRFDGRPLAFLACIDLAAQRGAIEWLPGDGVLLFFYDAHEQPWGFGEDSREQWRVVHVADGDLTGSVERPPGDLDEACCFGGRGVALEVVQMLPPPDVDEVQGVGLTDDEDEELWEVVEAMYRGLPNHHVGGYQVAVQDPGMAEDCAQALRMDTGLQKNGWRLLLQLDSDDEAGMMWGDVGKLYFWVPESDARRGDLSNVWLVLQCA